MAPLAMSVGQFDVSVPASNQKPNFLRPTYSPEGLGNWTSAR